MSKRWQVLLEERELREIRRIAKGRHLRDVAIDRLDAIQRLWARDAVHVAVMEGAGIRRIPSVDSGLDGFPGIERIR